MGEQRRYPRAPVNRPSQIRIDGVETDTQLINISEIGAAAYYSRPVVTDTPVELDFQLDSTDDDDAPLSLRGHVKHCYQRGASQILGIEFAGISAQALSIIRAYVKRRSTEV